MRFKNLYFILTILFVGQVSYSYSNDDMACKAVLCLSGGLVNQSGFQDCVAPIASYANIKIYDHKKFNETLTSISRDRYLKQCESADTSYINKITITYGRMEDVRL